MKLKNSIVENQHGPAYTYSGSFSIITLKIYPFIICHWYQRKLCMDV